MQCILFRATALRTGVAAFMLVLMICGSGFSEEKQTVADRIDLRVLYTGNPGSDRMKDFETLLKQHFAAVKTADYRKFVPHDAKDYDVVIFDWTTTYSRDESGKITWDDGGGFSAPQPPKLGGDFGRPTVLIGAAGGGICNQLNIAINWK